MTSHVVADYALIFHWIDSRSWYRSAAVCAHLIPILLRDEKEKKKKEIETPTLITFEKKIEFKMWNTTSQFLWH